MELTVRQLLAIMTNAQANVAKNKNWVVGGVPTDINKAVELLNKYMQECGITTPLRMVHFLANIAVESGELRYSEENLNYSASGLVATWPKRFNAASAKLYAHNPQKIANYVYANRNGNGNIASGDGWRYRGRGLIGYTGKANYREYAQWCGYDVVKQPELLAQRVGSVRSACHFFQKYGCNELADKDAGNAIRKRINGGLLGWTECQKYIARGKKALGV